LSLTTVKIPILNQSDGFYFSVGSEIFRKCAGLLFGHSCEKNRSLRHSGWPVGGVLRFVLCPLRPLKSLNKFKATVSISPLGLKFSGDVLACSSGTLAEKTARYGIPVGLWVGFYVLFFVPYDR
jgi:hypothetical protein